MVNSNNKGKRGEREFVKYLKEQGYQARRGQQYQGSPDSPDVISDLTHIHFEVKRTEKLQLDKSLKQATEDAGDKIPVLAHKKNRGQWVAILRMDDLIKLIR